MKAAPIVVGVIVALLTSAAAYQAGSAETSGGARSSLTIIAPASPGGGWDSLARTMQQTLRTEGIVNNVQVLNIPGAGGTIGLAALADREGNGQTLMITGLVMTGAVQLNDSQTTLADVTPMARLTEDYEVLVVPKASPYENLKDFVTDWNADPKGTAIGGGSLGGTDQLVAGMLAQSAGSEASDVNYIAYPGGGEALAALLSNTVKAGVSGYGEFSDQIDSGQLRALGLSAPERLPGVDIPTFEELGYKNATLPNWRGVLAPPGLEESEKATLLEILNEMQRSEPWRQALERNQWTDSYSTGDEFQTSLGADEKTVKDLLSELGLK